MDEMCNFYLMYWADQRHGTLEMSTCYTEGPPYYYWDTTGLLSNIPVGA